MKFAICMRSGVYRCDYVPLPHDCVVIFQASRAAPAQNRQECLCHMHPAVNADWCYRRELVWHRHSCLCFGKLQRLNLLTTNCAARHAASAFQIFFKSSVKRRISSWRASSVGARRIDDGCTVAVTNGARGESTNWARWIETRNFGPITACAAVDPRQMIARGLITATSASSHGRHAVTSAAFGFLWMRRLPRGSHLKCLTTFVT